MWIMIAGPYGTGASNAEQRADNSRELNRAALEVFRKGHVPVVGVNNAVPLIEGAGPGSYDEIMMPLSLALAERCDACLRVGGASRGADDEVSRFRAAGRPVYLSLDDVPTGLPL